MVESWLKETWNFKSEKTWKLNFIHFSLFFLSLYLFSLEIPWLFLNELDGNTLPFKKNQPFFNWNSQFRPNFISVYSVENVTYWTRNRRWGPPLFIFSPCPSVSVVKCMFCFVGTQYKDKQSDTHIVINNGTLNDMQGGYGVPKFRKSSV